MAEKNETAAVLGACVMISRQSASVSASPNNSSASSITIASSLCNFNFLSLIRFNNRPGVPITTSGRFFNFSIWRLTFAPPIKDKTFSSSNLAHGRITLVNWAANSCDGAKINNCVPSLGKSCSNNGKA